MNLSARRNAAPFLRDQTPPPWGRQIDALEACLARWRAYGTATVDMTISDAEDMVVRTPEGLEDYRNVGQSALRLLTEAMVLSARPDPRRILDIPCGGGRVTRQLVAFFPEAEIVVADIDKRKVEAVVSQFGVKSIEPHPAFEEPLPGSYDLIFVGSLVNHFDAPLFSRAVHRLLDGLAVGGVLVLTFTGRNWAAQCLAQERDAGRKRHRWWSPAVSYLSGRKERPSRYIAALEGPYARSGFAYVEIGGWTRQYGQSYGAGFSSPAWLMRLVQGRPDAMTIGMKERGFADLLDAVLLQKVR